MPVTKIWVASIQDFVPMSGATGNPGPIGGRQIIDQITEPTSTEEGTIWLDPSEDAPNGDATDILLNNFSDTYEPIGLVAKHAAQYTSIHGMRDTHRVIYDNQLGLDNRRFSASIPWGHARDDQAAANGTMIVSYIRPTAAITVSKAVLIAGTTGSAGGTLLRVGLFEVLGDTSLVLVASSGHTSTLGNTASTASAATFTTPFRLDGGVKYGIGFLPVGQTTAGSLAAASLRGLGTALSLNLASQVTGLTDLPSTVAASSITSCPSVPFMAVAE